MKIYLNNEKYKLEIFELTRSLIGEENIKFIEKIEDYEDLLFINIDRNIEIKYFNGNEIKYFSELENIQEISNNIYSKNMIIKGEIIKFFNKLYDISSDWGVLTGVKPTKVARKILSQYGEEESYKFLKNNLLLKDNKIKLLMNTVKVQDSYIKNLEKDNYSLYINIPFCPTRCDYCSFPTLKIEKHKELIPRYLEILQKEIKLLMPFLNKSKISTVYIGGGTPTSLNRFQLNELLSYVNDVFNINKNIEFTVEGGREDSLDYKKMKLLLDNNVNRLSLNPQSFKKDTLKLIGRKQNNEELVKRYYEGKELGFENINMDIILGLPKEELIDLKNTLEIIKTLKPDNLTVHTLSLKKGSKLTERDTDLNNEKNVVLSMMDQVQLFAKTNNYIPYYLYRQKQILGNMENIGYSIKGKECLYNILMMEDLGSIIGLGMGSSSKYIKENGKITKYRNSMNMKYYMENIDEIVKEKVGKLYE